MKMQKLGGYSAIVYVCLVVILIAFVLPFALKYGLNEQGAALDPEKVMTAYSSSPTTIYVAGILEILLSILGLLVVLGLYERMHGKTPYLTRIMIIAVSVSCALSITNILINLRGLALMDQISDVSIYKPILMMQEGLSAASNNISGWVLLLIAIAALSTKALPRFITYVFLVIGILQVISFLLPDITGTAGMIVLIVVVLFLLVSYIWLGVFMIRESAASITKPIEA
jgi:hypothetical protein